MWIKARSLRAFYLVPDFMLQITLIDIKKTKYF